jgi:DNA-binding transcriptional MerR regulator
MAADELAPGEYSIDDLAAATGVPSRTIRFYQSKGALPRPQRRGRVAVYTDDHAERLRVIADLQDRGLRLHAIRDLLGRSTRPDLSVQEWLGLGRKLGEPWADEPPRILTEDEVRQLIGDRPAGTIAALSRAGLVEPQGDGLPVTYLVRSPQLVEVALRLDDAGVDVDTSVGAEQIIRRHLAKTADDLVAYFADRAGQQFARGASPDELAELMGALRPLGADAVRVVFVEEVGRALREMFESAAPPGELSTAPRRTRPARRARPRRR